MGIKPAEEFVSPFLTMDAIRRTYDICPKPVNYEHFWDHNEETPRAVAPRIFRPPGRPRKKRTKLDILPLLLPSMGAPSKPNCQPKKRKQRAATPQQQEPNFREVQAPTLEEIR
ncbi:hypothetical protein PIB30_098437, partial [Stylosanthes scabra]|nr:hypothetical protein [Stylosanthes scabra]